MDIIESGIVQLKDPLKLETINETLQIDGTSSSGTSGKQSEIEVIDKIANKNVFICDICKKQFNYKPSIRRHMKRHFIFEKNFKCDCGVQFKYMSNLHKHVREVHYKVKSSVCHTCGNIFSNKHSLKRHMLSHSDERLAKCHICNKTYKTNDVLQQHIKTHGIKSFKCEICEKTFAHKYNLQLHLERHKPPHLQKQEQCNICGRTFHRAYMRSHYYEHKKRNSTNYRYPNLRYRCPVCSIELPRNALQQHVKLAHDQEYNVPFKCRYCQEEFAYRPKLQKHFDTCDLRYEYESQYQQ